MRFPLCLLLMLAVCCRCANLPEGQVKTGFIKAGGLQVYYTQTGKGSPLLLLHAGLQNHTMWDAQVQDLSPDFQVITIDLPFHGKTKGTDTSILARDVVKAVLDSLHLRQVSLAGLSMGAAVVQDFILAYPERVNKVILLASGINGYERKYPADSVSMSWYPKFAAALERKDTARAALEFALAWGEGVDHGDKLTKPVSRSVYATTLATLKEHRMQGWPNLQDEPTAMDGLAGIKLPLLLMHGDKDLPIIAMSNEFMEKTIPCTRRLLLRGAAHMLNLERPGEVTKAIREFLGKE